MTNDPPRIDIPGLSTGGTSRSKITLTAAVPSDPDQSIILGWTEEEGHDIMDSQVEALGSCCLSEYGLDNPPGNGIWVFEGEVIISFSKGGDPFEPQDYDSDLAWKGEWRPPNDAEVGAWRGHKAEHLTHKLAEEKKKEPTNIEKGLAEAKKISSEWPGNGTPDMPFSLGVVAKPKVGRSHYTPPSVGGNWCACGKHVSECCCGENHNIPHHHSGRAYDEEDYEQFDK